MNVAHPLVARPAIAATVTIRIDATGLGPQPIDFSWAGVTGAAVGGPTSERFVVATAVSGRVEKWTDGVWRDVGTPPPSSSPAELLALLENRVIAPGDEVRWVPSDHDVGQASAQAFVVTNHNDGWMAFGFGEFMFPTDTIVVRWDLESDRPLARDAYNPGIPTLPNFPSPLQDTNPYLLIPEGSPEDNKDNLTNISGVRVGGTIGIHVERQMITGDLFDFAIEPNVEFNSIAAYNSRLGFNTAGVAHTARAHGHGGHQVAAVGDV